MSRGTVAVSIPYFGGKQYLRRAVTSVLDQTYRDVRVYVINDADEDAPWDVLADVEDDRLFRFELTANRGPYFISSVVHSGCKAPYLLIQDADDWSEQTRVERLINVMDHTGQGAATSAQFVHTQNSVDRPVVRDFTDRLAAPLTTKFLDRARHHGLFRNALLDRIGGYYGGFRVAYDGFLMNSIFLLGELGYTTEALYHRLKRVDSITSSSRTGFGSPYRIKVGELLRSMYLEVLAEHRSGNPDLAKVIRELSARNVNVQDRAALAQCAAAVQAVQPGAGHRVVTLQVATAADLDA